ncbi:hypothetical protein VKT23_019383 [Stygiomarasmius scandens]|uniref:Uncharacterized protein n=1 Tax=Marasmiellus scandens TaxID=2682957 RepID=A0ABR1IQK1_9AGAR
MKQLQWFPLWSPFLLPLLQVELFCSSEVKGRTSSCTTSHLLKPFDLPISSQSTPSASVTKKHRPVPLSCPMVNESMDVASPLHALSIQCSPAPVPASTSSVKTAGVSTSQVKVVPKPAPVASQLVDSVGVKKTKHTQRAPTSHALVKVPTSMTEVFDIPAGVRQFQVPKGYSISSSVTPSFHLAPPRVLGDFTIPLELYGIKHRMEAIQEMMRARQVSAHYAML